MNSRAPTPLTATPAARLDPARTDMPVSTRFDDVYFSVDNGLEETREVYLRACGLPGNWAGRDVYTIGELGFGTGLNFLAAWQMWKARRPGPKARLHFVSIEGFPLDVEQLQSALSAWPELSELSKALIANWPGRVRGIHRLEFEGGVTLTLCHDDVSNALGDLTLSADAWFLDGFTPAKNPDMWTQDVLQSVFDMSAPGAQIGTFTVAGDVRRALMTAGFDVEKLDGFGRKRHRLQAKKPGVRDNATPDIRPVIVGAGIAGAALSRSFLARGITPIIIDPDDDSRASGNPAAVIKPRLDLQDRPESRFYLAAYLYARAAYEGPAVISTGVAQYALTEKTAERFEKLADQAVLPAADLLPLSADMMSDKTAIAPRDSGLWFGRALTIRPREITAQWMTGAERICARAEGLEYCDNGTLAVKDETGAIIAAGTHVYLCAGAQIETLLDAGDFDIGVPPGYQRGQVTVCQSPQSIKAPVNYGGYAIPLSSATSKCEVVLGVTHERSHRYVSSALQPEDDAANISAFKAIGGIPGAVLESRASVRVTTPDSVPRAGQIAPRLSVLTGLGGRGFVHAPLIAEALVSALCKDPLPVAKSVMLKLSPQPKRTAP